MQTNRSVLVTGGTGTFGNAVVGRLLAGGFEEVRIFSRDEKKQDDMRRRLADPRVTFYIGDVRNEQGLKDAMAGVDLVFSAAALKQVPTCEFFPIEAVRTNTLGTENVLNAAIAAGARRAIVLSTDKTV
jgi:UDP-N-acetylglucosamine 4,6-dehydratase/5-epimerase